MKADIASVVSLLTQQPRVLQKHPRLLVTIRKRILGQIPAVGTRGAMQITQTSHVGSGVTSVKSITCLRSLWLATDRKDWIHARESERESPQGLNRNYSRPSLRYGKHR